MRTWSRSRLQVRDAVLDYHTRAGVPPGGVSPSHFQQFQDILPEGVRLVVVDAVQPKGLMFKGGSGEKIVAILYFNNHYFPMKNLHTWFGQGFYCVDCEVTAQKKTKHRCKKNFICPRCQSKRCLHLPKLHKYCYDCTGMFSNPECYQEHKSNGVCAASTTCDDCSRWLPSSSANHNCTTSTTCPYCKKNHTDKEGCFVTPSEGKTVSQWRYILYDFETFQDKFTTDEVTKQHKVNYIYIYICIYIWGGVGGVCGVCGWRMRVAHVGGCCG